uniref:Uncharacterized protein n=3 Tax=Meloidogyne TaxID=189290 RepID=A0A915NN18_9BILA
MNEEEEPFLPIFKNLGKFINSKENSQISETKEQKVNMEKMVDRLVNEVTADIERVIKLNVRCDINGLELKKETIEIIKEMKEEINKSQQKRE